MSALTDVSEPTGRQIMEGIMDGRLPRPNTAAFRAMAATCGAKVEPYTSDAPLGMLRPP